VVRLAHGGKALKGLKDGDDGGEVPEGGDVEVGEEEEEEGEEEAWESSRWSKRAIRARREAVKARL